MTQIIQPATISASKMESKDFLWGAATAAHQIEGGDIDSNWMRLEKEGKVKNGDTTLAAVDGYNRSIDDIKLLKELGLNAYRFSIEWARVEPKKGVFDEAAINHYSDLVKELKRNNIEPIVTLHHFTDPGWITDQGGWINKKTIDDFNNYVNKIAEYMGKDVKYWITINEPNVIINSSYLIGIVPPYRKNPIAFYRAFNNVLTAHRRAYKTIHSQNAMAKVGIAYNFTDFVPKKENWFDKNITKLLNYIFSFNRLDKIKNELDFIGLNQYKRYNIGWGWPIGDQFYVKDDRTDMGWNIQPEGLGHAALLLSERYQKPIMVTENGLADRTDKKRAKFIRDNIKSLKDAELKGVDIIGYLHWSLMDNFEWLEGYDMKFGLYSVNPKTFERIARPSAIYYRDLIKEYRK